MKLNEIPPMRISRREFLKTTLLAAGLSTLPLGIAKAEAPPRYRRVNVSDPQLGPRMLASYKKAIRVMLALPPTDPRNWYRHALIHTMDCPHGNWWFLPWHRAYLGWFEQICRELSGDPEFALPYWDWTAEPSIPDAMFYDVLDPNNAAFIAKGTDLEKGLKKAVANAGYWTSDNHTFSPESQYGQLLSRMIRFPDDLWFDVVRNPLGSFFFDQPHTRGLTKQNPMLKGNVLDAVALKTLYPALAAKDFTTFGSFKSGGHSIATGSGILEGQPHNLVHNCIGTRDCNLNDSNGFMVDMMSPVDPIFFLHHANIDRLWDVWSRKQKLRGLPTLPDGYLIKTNLPKDKKSKEELNTDYFKWAKEPFLFFVDAKKGSPVKKIRADDYETIGDFDYDYQPGGSGDDVIALPNTLAQATLFQQRTFNATIVNQAVSTTKPGSAAVELTTDVIEMANVNHEKALVAKITLNFPPMAHGTHIVVVGGPDDASTVGPDSPFFAGTLSMFGRHMMQGAFTFIVPISGPVSYLRTNNLFSPSNAMNIRVVPFVSSRPILNMPVQTEGSGVEVISIVVESY